VRRSDGSVDHPPRYLRTASPPRVHIDESPRLPRDEVQTEFKDVDVGRRRPRSRVAPALTRVRGATLPSFRLTETKSQLSISLLT